MQLHYAVGARILKSHAFFIDLALLGPNPHFCLLSGKASSPIARSNTKAFESRMPPLGIALGLAPCFQILSIPPSHPHYSLAVLER